MTLTSPFIDLPSPLGVILARLPVTSSPVNPLVQRAPVSPWLFPGRIPGQPMTAAGMARRLAAAGISVRASRNTALITLAADLPVKVLSDLLGISTTTSVLWARQAARDWNGYIAAVTEVRGGHLGRPPWSSR